MSTQNFTLPESMRISELTELKTQLDPLIEAKQDLSLDGSAVSSIDTAGIQIIVAMHAALAAAENTLTVSNPSESITKAAEVIGVSTLLNFG